MSKVMCVDSESEPKINSLIAAADELKRARFELHQAQMQMVSARTRIVRWCVDNGMDSLLKVDEPQLNRYADADRKHRAY